MSMHLQLRQSQSLVMTPQLQQAIKLLQMSNLDLAEYVSQEIERNPLLEATSSTPDERRDREQNDDRPVTQEANDVSSAMKTDSATRAEETFDTGLENIYADESRADTMNNAAASDNAAARALYTAEGFVQTGLRPAYYARRTGPAADALTLTWTAP